MLKAYHTRKSLNSLEFSHCLKEGTMWWMIEVWRSDKGLTLKTSASESLYSGQFTLSTQLMISKLPSSSIRIVSIHKFYIGITKSMAKTFHHTILGLPSVMHLQCVLCLTCKPEKKKFGLSVIRAYDLCPNGLTSCKGITQCRFGWTDIEMVACNLVGDKNNNC